MTLIVNLFGGPGTGKSTNAARLFAMLKDAGVEAELVTEYAKELVWSGQVNLLKDQRTISEEQLSRVTRLLDKVEVIVTDSPILLGVLYSPADTELHRWLEAAHNNHLSLNYLLERGDKYSQTGRLQSECEAKVLDKECEELLNRYCVDHRGHPLWHSYPGTKEGCEGIFVEVLRVLPRINR